MPTLKLERGCGMTPVCGIDEAGRGPWAGPVCAAAVILPDSKIPRGIHDSKLLSPAAREEMAVKIKARAIAWAVAFASVEEIAELNILHATGLAMRRAVEQLTPQPVMALIDGNYAFAMPCDVKTVVGGDAISLSIAAASIIAKTTRDALMVEMDAMYPGYGFASNKGYNAKVHWNALKTLGPSPIHRMAWSPVKMALQGELDLEPEAVSPA